MNKLLFFNNEGYPYNFEWNSISEQYEGKLMFDENSSDTFKTIGLYIFEEVPPIHILDDNTTFVNIEILNLSGISYTTQTRTNEAITNVRKVNSSPAFRSKWVYGENFDKKFPKSTIVSFSNILTPNTDLALDYYTVLEVKPNAFLINTETTNDTYSTTFTGGYVTSHNIISVSDFSSGSTLLTQVQSYNLYPEKKITVSGSELNDGLYSFVKQVTGTSQFNLYNLSGSTDQTIKINFTLYTERPKIYQGGVDITIGAVATSGTTIIFDNSLYSFMQEFDDLINLNEPFEIIFEDYNDNDILPPYNPVFTVEKIIKTENLGLETLNLYRKINKEGSLYKNFSSQNPGIINYDRTYLTGCTIYDQIPSQNKVYDYYIEYLEATEPTLTPNDIITLSGESFYLNHNKSFKILEISARTAYDLRYDYWLNYNYNSGITSAQESAVFNDYTLEEYIEYISLQQTELDPQATADRTTRLKVEQIVIDEFSTGYTMIRTLKPNEIDTVICSQSSVFNTTYTGDVIAYLTTNKFTLTQNILSNSASTTDFSRTIDSLNSNYSQFLNTYGIKLYHSLYDGSEKLAIESIYHRNFSADTYYNADVYINNVYISGETFSGMTSNYLPKVLLEVSEKLYSEYVFSYETDKLTKNGYYEIFFNLNDDNLNYGFLLNINETTSYIAYNDSTEQTLIDFVQKYQWLYLKSGIQVTSTGSTLKVITLYPGIHIYNLDITVNKFSYYSIDKEVHNVCHTVAGNEIILNNNVYEYGLSTGMIIDIIGSKYNINNGAYNIVGFGGPVTTIVNTLELSYQGPFFNDSSVALSATTRQTLRKPRESYTKTFKYRCRFLEDRDEIFYYSFDGTQLDLPENYGNNLGWKYTGIKPLYNPSDPKTLFLNPNYNTDVRYLNDPKKQKTQFNKLYFALDQFDSSTNVDYKPEPLQVFLGYNSPYEGVHSNTMIIEKVEDLVFSGITTPYEYFILSAGTIEYVTPDTNFSFLAMGFEKGQYISLHFRDRSFTGQTIFENIDTYKITNIGMSRYISPVSGFTGQSYKIYVDTKFLRHEFKTYITSASTIDTTFAGYDFAIKVEPKPMLYCPVYGETEGIDSRYDIALRNLGISLPETIEYIFKYSDINEEGVDYILLNQKRKEMLTIYPELWNYVGSYKALINAINFFGYNDLELYEYYRNIDVNSPLYQQLHKILIPDIFDNSVVGWNAQDYIKNSYNKTSYKKTDLFNLTYRITDEDGNYVLTYSLEEAQYKLNGLKKWLIKNVVPLSANIIDITGVADTVSNLFHNSDVSNQITKFTTERNTAGVNFNWQETYIQNGEYAFTVDFFNIKGLDLKGWTAKIQTFGLSGSTLIPKQYFKLMKNDYYSFNFTLNKNIDPFLYIETCWFNDDGMGIIQNKMTDTTTFRNYILINNNYHIPSDYNYLNIDGYYTFNENGYITIRNEYYPWALNLTSDEIQIDSDVDCTSATIKLEGFGNSCVSGTTLVVTNSESGILYTYELYKEFYPSNPIIITSSTSASFNIMTNAPNGNYYVYASKDCNSFTSNEVVVNIDGPLVMSITPSSPHWMCSGGTLSIQGYTQNEINYQLRRNSVDEGAVYVGDNSNHTFIATGITNGDLFDVVAIATCKSVTSSTLAVYLYPQIASQSNVYSGGTGCYGNTYLYINASGDSSYTIEYSYNNGISYTTLATLLNYEGIKSYLALSATTSTTPYEPTSVTYRVTQRHGLCPESSYYTQYVTTLSIFADQTSNTSLPTDPIVTSSNLCTTTLNAQSTYHICTGQTITIKSTMLHSNKDYYIVMKKVGTNQTTEFLIPANMRPTGSTTFIPPYSHSEVGIRAVSKLSCFDATYFKNKYFVKIDYPNPVLSYTCIPTGYNILLTPVYTGFTYYLHRDNSQFFTYVSTNPIFTSFNINEPFSNIATTGSTYYVGVKYTNGTCANLSLNCSGFTSNRMFIPNYTTQMQFNSNKIEIKPVYTGVTYNVYKNGALAYSTTFGAYSSNWSQITGYNLVAINTYYVEAVISDCKYGRSLSLVYNDLE